MEKLIIFSAPSGSGKTTVVRDLIARFNELEFSISATTRKQRPNEVDGVDYYFLGKEEFKERIANGDFLEHEEVYGDLFYGTLKSEVERIWKLGKAVIFDVDVVGGLNIKKYFGSKALAIFLRPPSVEILRDRLKNRNTESDQELEMRVQKAKDEMKFEEDFDIILINDVLDNTLVEARSLVRYFLNKNT